MHSFFTVAALLLTAYTATSTPVASTPAALDGPNPSDVYLESWTYGGSGCPQGTVSNSISDDRTSFTMIFDQFIASVGPGVAITQSRRNCQLLLNVHYPQGWQYSVFSANYRGYVQLDDGVTGTQKSTYYFQGETDQASSQSDFAGPDSEDYLVTDNIDQTSMVWSPCGDIKALNVNSQVRVNNNGQTDATGEMTTDSVDGTFQHIIGFQWRTC